MVKRQKVEDEIWKRKLPKEMVAFLRTQPAKQMKGKERAIVQTKMKRRKARAEQQSGRNRPKSRLRSRGKTTRIRTCHTGVGSRIV